jgi:DNA-binding transcriptional LysR family regulator
MVENLLRFKRVVEAGSISKASRLLFVSQPALSASMKLLEQQYGVPILERHHAGVRPTAYGDILYRTATKIEQNVLSIENEILTEKLSRDPSERHTEVTIGCSTIWNDFFMPEVIRTIETIDTYEIHVVTDTSEQLLADLIETDRYDFVLCRLLEGKRYRKLQSIPLFRSQPAVFVNDHHPVFSTGLERQDLLKLKWIKLKNLPSLRARDLTPSGLAYLPESFLPPAISFEVEDLMAAIQLMQDNYVVLLPLALADLLERYNVKPLPLPTTLTRSYWLGLVYARDTEMPLHVRDLINKIRLYFSGRARGDTDKES